MSDNLPVPIPHAKEIATLATGVGLALASLMIPGAGLLQPFAALVIDKWIKKPEMLLIERLKAGNINDLSESQIVEFYPMAYRFFEAAKEGEYTHNLKLLADFMAGVLNEDVPDAAKLVRMSRRIEGLSSKDLKTIALINSVSLAHIDP